MKHKILLVDDDIAFRQSMVSFLDREGFQVKAVASGDEAVALVRQQIIPFSLALVDYHMPLTDGPSCISQMRIHAPNLPIFTFSGDDSVDAFNRSLQSGAVYFLEKDISDAKLLGLLHRTCLEVERRTMPLQVAPKSENSELIAQIGMIGESQAMAEVARLVLKFAPTDESVLIRGENGTGKEKVARALHRFSKRSDKPFIAINCAAIPENLIESELFGSEKGSFTGSLKSRKGLFEAANGGTILLDEIGDMPRHLQATLLRVLQERTVTPVGSNEVRKVDFRLIAATNAPLEKLIAQDRFRQDLYFRLNVLPIHIPSLDERPEDIAPLTLAFLNELRVTDGERKSVTKETIELLTKRKWPGNVRELEGVIKFLYRLSPGEVLDPALLRRVVQMPQRSQIQDIDSFKAAVERDEKQIILGAVKSGGSISGASRILGLSRSTIREKMRKFGIEIKAREMGDVGT